MHVEITSSENILHYFDTPKTKGREPWFPDECDVADLNYLLRISDHLRRAESFRKDSKGFRLSKRVTQFIELNEFATKT
jgi:hypothetical protein